MNILKVISIPYFKDGSGIHIKEKNKGKFTQAAKQHGMGVLEFASHVLSNKDKYSPTLVKRANFAHNSKAWKHQKGGLILKFQKPASPIKRLDIEGLRNDPEFKKNYNWYMNDRNLEVLQDSMVNRNMGFAQRIAVLGLVIPESGGDTKPHGNGAIGLVGWRGPRAKDVPNTLDGLLHKLMSEIYDNPNAKDWSHGGLGTGIQTGKEMLNLFKNTPNIQQAGKAYMKGYVRPEKSEHNKRLSFLKLLKTYMK